MTARREDARRAARSALREELFDRVRAGDLGLVEAVRMMRKVAGKSQADYAALVGVSPRVLMDFERGVGNPTLATVEKLLKPFGLSLTVRRQADDEEPPRRPRTLGEP
jgi:transcriptional regulator with XRE-family HTH domain